MKLNMTPSDVVWFVIGVILIAAFLYFALPQTPLGVPLCGYGPDRCP